MKSWREIWERKGRQAASSAGHLSDLLRADGFDSGAGKMTEELIRHVAREAARRLEIVPPARVAESGCGAGAFSLALRDLGFSVVGADYSFPLLSVARRALPNGTWLCAEAARLPLRTGEFDAAICHSVFQYFPDRRYAEAALWELVRIASRALILDIPDASRKEECERARGVSDPPHQFYPREWFLSVAESRGWTAHLFDQDLPGYGNAPFRFNALLRRP